MLHLEELKTRAKRLKRMGEGAGALPVVPLWGAWGGRLLPSATGHAGSGVSTGTRCGPWSADSQGGACMEGGRQPAGPRKGVAASGGLAAWDIRRRCWRGRAAPSGGRSGMGRRVALWPTAVRCASGRAATVVPAISGGAVGGGVAAAGLLEPLKPWLKPAALDIAAEFGRQEEVPPPGGGAGGIGGGLGGGVGWRRRAGPRQRGSVHLGGGRRRCGVGGSGCVGQLRRWVCAASNWVLG